MSVPNFIPTKRASGHPSESENVWVLTANETSSGIHVTDDSAMRTGAVFSCVKVLSEDVSSLPCITYKRRNKAGKDRARDFGLYRLLRTKPNRYQNAQQFWEMAMVHLAMRGNFVAQKLRNRRLELSELYPLHPDRVKPDWEENEKTGEETLSYIYTPPKGAKRRFRPDELFHVRGLATHGVWGMSPIEQAKEAIGLAKAAEIYGAKYFNNAVRPSGVLEHPQKLGDKAADRIRDQWNTVYSGVENAHKVIVLEEGMSWKQMGLTNEQAQFLESRKFQRSEIASWFRVPPHMIGDLERATYSNIEHQSLEYVMHTLRPWLIRIEQAVLTQLIDEEDQEDYFVEFLVDALLRGDTKTRMESYAIGRNMGLYSIDELRSKENENPLPNGWGEHHIEPMNMRVIGEEAPVQEDKNQDKKDPKNDQVPDKIDENKDKKRDTNVDLSPVAQAVVGRILRREEKLPKGDLEQWGKHLERSREDVLPVLESLHGEKAGEKADEWIGEYSRGINFEEETKEQYLSKILVEGA